MRKPCEDLSVKVHRESAPLASAICQDWHRQMLWDSYLCDFSVLLSGEDDLISLASSMLLLDLRWAVRSIDLVLHAGNDLEAYLDNGIRISKN